LFGQRRERVGGSPFIVTIVAVHFTMDFIRAALGDGVDDAAGGAPVFRSVIGSVDLEFLDGSLGAGIACASPSAFFGEERLVVVRAIDRIVVEQRALTANTEQAETVAVVHDCGRQQREIRPTPPIDGEVADLDLVDDRGKIRRRGVDER